LAAENSKFKMLRRKAPQIIASTIIIILVVYISFEFLEDLFVEGTSLKKTVASWGYPGIFGLMVLESSSLPIPSEIVLPFSGYLVSTGQLNFWETVVVATIAAIIGSLIDYYIGLKGVEALAKRRVLGRVLFSKDQLALASKWFDKYGAIIIFLARLIPGIRTLISFPAGAAKMPVAKFLVFTVAGCLLWNSILIYVGYYLGSNWTEVAGISHYIIIAVIAAFVTLVVVYLVMRRRRRKARNQVQNSGKN
jgi:membrane protein DedA with SNARE-associated domain